MISRRAFLLGMTLPLIVRPAMGLAQDACVSQTHIVALCDYVIANRSKLPKLASRRNGALPAYLNILYKGLNAQQTEELLEPLASGRIDRAGELYLAWRISNLGLEDALAAAPDAEKDLLTPGFGLSPLRAAVRSGEVPALFDRIARLAPGPRSSLEINIIRSVVDIDDESKKAIGTEALTRKLTVLAGGFAATQDDPDAWPALLAALNDKATAAQITNMIYWLPSLKGKPPLPRSPAADAQGEMARSLIHQVGIAAAQVPEREYLSNYLNFTGDYAGAGRAAAAIVDLTRDGATIDMETAWLVIYEALVESQPDPAAMDTILRAIAFAGTRFGGDNVREVLDNMLALEALKQLAATGTGTVPARVEGTSDAFQVQYAAWKEAATAIGTGGDMTPLRSSGRRLSIAANLMFAAGRDADLAKFLTSTVPNSDSIKLAELFAEALDRRCSAYLTFPAESVLMPGAPMFKFEPQS